MLAHGHRDYVPQILVIGNGAQLIPLLPPDSRKCLAQIGVDALGVAK